MAQHLVSIHGTEKDKVNCPFYYKIGACRHGDRCSRIHNKPLFSQTILLENLYQSPDQIIASAATQGLVPPSIPEDDLHNHFDDFYLDIYEEMARYGHVEELHVCENLADHLAGNTYVKFRDEESAQAALAGVHGRYYAGRPVKAEFSPVTDFREGKCRPFERYGQCERGDFCHFMHLRKHPGATALYDDASPSDSRRQDQRIHRSSRDRREADRYRDRDGSGHLSPRDYGRYDEERDAGRDRRRESDRKRGRDRDRERGYRRARRASYERESYDTYELDRSRDRRRSRDRDRNKDRDRDRDRDHDRNRDRDRDVERDRKREYVHHRERDRGCDYDWYHDRSPDHDKDREQNAKRNRREEDNRSRDRIRLDKERARTPSRERRSSHDNIRG